MSVAPGFYVSPLRNDPDLVTGYATENVVPVTDDEQEALRAWVDAIEWATGERLEECQ